MPRYLCLQRPLPGGDHQKPSPSEMQEVYARYGAWQEKYKSQLADPGGPLMAGRLLTHEGSAEGVAEVSTVGGYMIISAASLEEAIDVARECPALIRPGSGVEVLEIRGA